MAKRTSKLEKVSLIEQVKTICSRLGPKGWNRLFLAHGLDILENDLSTELTRSLEHIDRNQPGFEDFCLEGTRGIEPGLPEQSLLFHGLASPGVLTQPLATGQTELEAFPTLAELETVERYVYAASRRSLNDVRAVARGPLAIVVFAREYRQAKDTVHGKHAAMCYSRTGISRVGTDDAYYSEMRRGFLPHYDDDEEDVIRVLPCKFGAYLATLVPGDKSNIGPLRFLDPSLNTEGRGDGSAAQRQADKAGQRVESSSPAFTYTKVGDAERRFWVPVHKLFNGSECLAEFDDLQVAYKTHHCNEKLRRIHLRFGEIGHDGGWHEPEISQAPFVFTEGIATISEEDDQDGSGVLSPTPHESLVAVAKKGRARVDYAVPAVDDTNGRVFVFESSLGLTYDPSGTRSAPE